VGPQSLKPCFKQQSQWLKSISFGTSALPLHQGHQYLIQRKTSTLTRAGRICSTSTRSCRTSWILPLLRLRLHNSASHARLSARYLAPCAPPPRARALLLHGQSAQEPVNGIGYLPIAHPRRCCFLDFQKLELFRSYDKRERDALKNVLHRVYAKMIGYRSYIRSLLSQMLLRYVDATSTLRHSCRIVFFRARHPTRALLCCHV
jgi:hypothetical protein